MSEQHDSLNRSLLMIVCKTEATGNMIADRLEELERENAALRETLHDIMTESDEQVIWRMARAALEKEAQL